ncbi:hypothetical protein BC835DRAFT_818775 [Cytidiella melzeri]|nr:hypothetical protein BC835DRAFT_818775 [Cytidiella melzeri]
MVFRVPPSCPHANTPPHRPWHFQDTPSSNLAGSQSCSGTDTRRDYDHYGSSCNCTNCLARDQEVIAMYDGIGEYINIKNLRNVLFAVFALHFVYKIVCRAGPIDIFQNMFVDASDAASRACSLVFLGPFTLARAIIRWLFRQCVSFLSDIMTSLGLIPVFARIILRLAGA